MDYHLPTRSPALVRSALGHALHRHLSAEGAAEGAAEGLPQVGCMGALCAGAVLGSVLNRSGCGLLIIEWGVEWLVVGGWVVGWGVAGEGRGSCLPARDHKP